jgi:uncharacterized membrane protein HdeD (DUF308 family)
MGRDFRAAEKITATSISNGGTIMTIAPHPPTWIEVRHELSSLGSQWGLFVGLGVVLIILGFLAVSAVAVASLATALFVGWLMLIGGVVETVGAFSSRRWSGFFLHLLSGVLSIIVGLLFVRAPVDAMLALTLLLACLLMVGGSFRIIAALTYGFSSWGWPLVSGIIDVILGVMIWMQWPASALWVMGLFLGISLLFRGGDWIGVGLAVRALRRPSSESFSGTPATS